MKRESHWLELPRLHHLQVMSYLVWTRRIFCPDELGGGRQLPDMLLVAEILGVENANGSRSEADGLHSSCEGLHLVELRSIRESLRVLGLEHSPVHIEQNNSLVWNHIKDVYVLVPLLIWIKLLQDVRPSHFFAGVLEDLYDPLDIILFLPGKCPDLSRAKCRFTDVRHFETIVMDHLQSFLRAMSALKYTEMRKQSQFSNIPSGTTSLSQ